MQRCEACLERRRGFAPGVPDEEQATTLDTFSTGGYEVTAANTAAIRHARFFVDAVHPGLYIYGGVGSGKTALACAALNELHRTGIAVRFYRVTELLKRLVTEGGDDVLDRVSGIPVIVLDDIGAQKGSDYGRQMMQAIYDARIDRGHRTIWTSNLDLDDLATFMGEDRRLVSRIVGNAKLVNLDGPDYRIRKARKRKA